MPGELEQLTPASPEDEDLREFYITPLYLQTMRDRVRDWDDEFIQHQYRLFHKTIRDYPEVLELLEGELHRRHLNRLRKSIRGRPEAELRELMKRNAREPDYVEVIQTELEIRQGFARLTDASEANGNGARIVGED